MADLKISELTNLTAADPANDMIPIVDVSATPPASGSTKRISINNILACSPTATLASATITGDLTVDTSTLKVDSANNRVGIGTASPINTLHVNGEVTLPINNLQYWNAYYSGGFKSVAAGYAGYTAFATNGDFVLANTDASAAGAGSALTFYNRYRISNAGIHTWETVGGVAGTAMTLNSTGNLVLKGGTAGANGVGITFPTTQVASSDANCLDDYEEGAWTPVVTAGTGTLTSVTGQTGAYTKVGRMVVATCFFTVATNGTGGSFIAVAGLPFANGNLANIGIGRIDGTTGQLFQGKLNPTAATINLWKYDNSYPASDGAQFPMTIVYYI